MPHKPAHPVMEEYWNASLNKNIEMYVGDWAGETERPKEPLKFKPYRSLPRYPLASRLGIELGRLKESFLSLRGNDEPAARLNHDRLSRLLYYGYGVSRLDVGPAVIWPYHRFVPSPRAFFPIELYCWIPQIDHLPTGIYYYDPAHHSLVLLRRGDYRETVGTLARADLQEAETIFFLSALFWKNAFLYRNYSYRLMPQEAGILTGNLLLVSTALGFRSHVHHQFVDAGVNRLLGLEPPDESAMTVVSMRQHRSRVAGMTDVRISGSDVIETLPELRHEFVQTSRLNERKCARMLEVHKTTLIETPQEIVSPPCVSQPNFLHLGDPIEAAEDLIRPGAELGETLRRRTSGLWIFNSPVVPIPVGALWQTVRYALDPHDSDVSRPGTGPPVECFLAVNKVIGVEAGLYRLRPGGSALELWSKGSVASLLQSGHHIDPPQINYSLSNFVIFLIVNRADITKNFGARGFRIAGQEAGIVAQRLCAMGASMELTGRVHNGYKARRIIGAFGLSESAYVPLFQIIFGTARPTARYQMPVIV
jgi:SagB-type dehydrogenase family enzyme